jgi:hypothetical protein
MLYIEASPLSGRLEFYMRKAKKMFGLKINLVLRTERRLASYSLAACLALVLIGFRASSSASSEKTTSPRLGSLGRIYNILILLFALLLPGRGPLQSRTMASNPAFRQSIRQSQPVKSGQY